jgi:hypothetical protein
MHLEAYSKSDLLAWSRELQEHYRGFQASGLDLDLTRGKPSIAQLQLSAALDGILDGDYCLADGSDARGYGGLDGIPEARVLAAQWLGLTEAQVLVAGNSSLTLMYLFMLSAHVLGLQGAESPWCRQSGGARFLCPVPGYDRHFAICEELGIEMLPVPMNADGPDMDVVESLVTADPSIKGIWCVPKFSNPTGVVYSDQVVRRLAELPGRAGDGFFIFWDNAYRVHEFDTTPVPLLNIMDECRRRGSQGRVVIFGSTSKVTFAGAGLAFMGASVDTLNAFRRHLSVLTIGPDKVGQSTSTSAFSSRHGGGAGSHGAPCGNLAAKIPMRAATTARGPGQSRHGHMDGSRRRLLRVLRCITGACRTHHRAGGGGRCQADAGRCGLSLWP